jgi:uncharacterized protein YegP (UPF0339 family)
MSKFELFGGSNSYYYRLKASNGEIILSSESYTTKQSCQNGIQSVQTNASEDAHYDRRTSVIEQPYFVLKAANGEIIGNSQMYSSNSARESGIEAVKREAPNAQADDLTKDRGTK